MPFNTVNVRSISTSLQGDLQLQRLPKSGEVSSLLSRILQFRMKTFNRREETVGDQFFQASGDSFPDLKATFGFHKNSSSPAFSNHLGNASKLTYRKSLTSALTLEDIINTGVNTLGLELLQLRLGQLEGGMY